MKNKAWFALAEFVDNALQSYLDNKEQLLAIEGEGFSFHISIRVSLEEDSITIRDNAGGISYQNFIRAFEPANIPLDNTGLSEFGMGMKIASIWFADKYIVRSSALSEDVERLVEFNLAKVMSEEKEVLDVQLRPVSLDSHYTEVVLHGLSHNAPARKQQLTKVKDHLASIYRKFLKTGELTLSFNGEPLKYEEPEILYAPYADTPDGPARLWKEEINIVTEDFSVVGFVGLLKEMNAINSGFSLFRRGRIIEGSHDEKYHPRILSGQAGSPRDKRLFGDLEISGLKVSFDKGSFRQVEELEAILELVKEQLAFSDHNLLRQGDKYRKVTLNKEAKEKIVAKVTEKLKSKSKQREARIKLQENVNSLEAETEEKIATAEVSNVLQSFVGTVTEEFEKDGRDYVLNLHVVQNPAIINLYELTYSEDSNSNSIIIHATINLDHTFFGEHNIFLNPDSFEPIIALLKALIISEVISLSQGTKFGGNIRLNMNKLLTN